MPQLPLSPHPSAACALTGGHADRSSRPPPRPAADVGLRGSLAAARDALFSVAAVAHGCGLLDDASVQAVRLALRAGRRHAPGAASVSALAHAVDGCERLAAEIAARVRACSAGAASSVADHQGLGDGSRASSDPVGDLGATTSAPDAPALERGGRGSAEEAARGTGPGSSTRAAEAEPAPRAGRAARVDRARQSRGDPAARRAPRPAVRRRRLTRVPSAGAHRDTAGAAAPAPAGVRADADEHARPTSARQDASGGGRSARVERVERTGAERVDLSRFVDREDQLEAMAQRVRVMRQMDRGLSAAATVAAEGLPASRVRWAQRAHARWRATGEVHDGRWTRQTSETVMTPEVQGLVLRSWFARPGASCRAIWRQVVAALRPHSPGAAPERQVGAASEIPAYDTVRRYLERLPKTMHLVRERGLRAWEQQAKLVIRFDPTTAANEVWQLDHTPLDHWVAVEVAPQVWEVRPAYLTVALDVHSRAITSWVVSLQHPDAWTTALLLRQGVLPKADSPLCGLPGTVVPDHGKDFLSHAVANVLRALGIQLDPCPPYYPNVKGKIERVFLTIKDRLAILPGAMANVGTSEGAALKRLDRLITFPQLREAVGAQIAAYHATTHRELGETPLARWERTARLAMPPAEEDLNALLLQSTGRRVTKEGLRFTHDGQAGQYVAPELLDYQGVDVILRFNPEDLDSVLVYAAASSEYLCEAWRVGGRYEVADVQAWNRGYRQALKQRTTAYAAEVAAADRRSAQAWDEERAAARERADAFRARGAERERDHRPDQEHAAAVSVDAQATAAAVEAHLTRFRRQDRGEDRAVHDRLPLATGAATEPNEPDAATEPIARRGTAAPVPRAGDPRPRDLRGGYPRKARVLAMKPSRGGAPGQSA